MADFLKVKKLSSLAMFIRKKESSVLPSSNNVVLCSLIADSSILKKLL